MNRFFIFLLALIGCESSSNKTVSVVKNNDKVEFFIDTLFVSPTQSSQLGSFFINEKNLYYVDQLFGIIEQFDENGNQIRRCLQVMNGPEELMSITEVIPYPAGFIVRSDWQFYFYDKDWNYQRKFMMDTDGGVPFDDLVNNPKSTYTGMYELQNYDQKTTYFDGQLLVKLDVEHPMFNGFSTRAYYKEASIFGLININIGKLKLIDLARPDSYDAYSFIPFHIFFDYHLGEREIFTTFEPDPLIYQYDLNFELQDSFGEPGKEMLTSYPQTDRIEAAFDNSLFSDSRNKDGFYKNIFVYKDFIFRTYRQGTKSESYSELNNPLRLQIYLDKVLVQDMTLPKRFKILGKIGDTYFADGYFNEQEEEQGLFTIKME